MLRISFLIKSLLVSFFLISTLGCTKQVEEKDGPLGHEASDEEYQKAIGSALGNVSLANAKVGQSVTYENNQRIELGPVIKTEEFKHTLISIKEDTSANTIKFILFRDQYEFDPNNGGIISDTHFELPPVVYHRLPMAVASMTNKENAFRVSSESICDGIDETDSAGHTYDCMKRFNLKNLRKWVLAPEAIRAKPNCMGLPDCKILVQEVSFDEVKWRKGLAVNKVSLKYEIAQNIPDLIYITNEAGALVGYLPPVVSFCQRGHIDYNGSDLIVSLCTVLKDFEVNE